MTEVGGPFHVFVRGGAEAGPPLMRLGNPWEFGVVNDLMLRPRRGGRPVTPELPTLVVQGAHGSGKTLLLDGLREWADQETPWAVVDFAAFGPEAGVPEVLAALAFHLGRPTPLYGELGFPRLATGLAVMRMSRMPEDPDEAHAAVAAALSWEHDPSAVREILAEAAGAKLGPARSGTGVPAAGRRPAGRVGIGRARDGYGRRVLRDNALDVLRDLHRWSTHRDIEDNRRKISELLWDAFLADVRDGFEKSRRSDRFVLSALVLLDNADTPLGIRFLTELAEVRAGPAPGARPAPVPLVFVAASRGALLEASSRETVVEVGFRERGTVGRLDPVPPWVRLRLADLAPADIEAALTEEGALPGEETRITAMVMGLTGGHPGSVSLLLAAIGRHPGLRLDLAALLDVPPAAPDSGASSVGTAMLRGLLGLDRGERAAARDLDDLATYATATVRQHGMWLGAGDDPLILGGLAGFAQAEAVLWPRGGGAAPAVLRRLLLRRLALRDRDLLPEIEGLPDAPGAATQWGRAFGVMCRNIMPSRPPGDAPYARDGRPLTTESAGMLYHALAMGDLGRVAAHFDQAVGHGSPEAWLAFLTDVVRAPRRPRRPGVAALDPVAQALAVASQAQLADEEFRPMAELVAASWVAGDPFLDHRRRVLHVFIASHLTDLATRWPRDVEPLHEAAERHRKAATSWD